MSFGTLKPKVGGKDYLRLEEVVGTFSLPPDEWVTLRFLPQPVISIKNHWIQIVTKTGKEISLPRICLAHNMDGSGQDKLDSNGEKVECIYCTLPHGNRESGAPANAQTAYYANAIVREEQEDEPRRKAEHTKGEQRTGHKDIKSKSWTPVRVIRLTATMVQRIQELSENNRVKRGDKTRAFDVTDAKYGIDLRIKYKPKGAGSDKYSIDADGSGRTPLTADEQAYLTWHMDESMLELIGLRSVREAEDDFKTLNIRGGDVPEDDEDDGYTLGGGDDEEDEAPRKKKRRAAFDDDEEPKRKKRRAAFDDDEDETPRKKKRRRPESEDEPKRKKKRRSEADEDEAPRRKKRRRPVFDDE